MLGASSHCIATHASDVAVALVALDAVLHIAHAGGTRDMALEHFYRLPGATPQVENVLRPGELIVGITFPRSVAARSTYVKARDRAQYEFALASAAVALDVEHGTISNARIALGGVGTIPWRAREGERELWHTRDACELSACRRRCAARRTWAGQNDFKIALAKRVIVRALETANA